jgi:hypothetical protein
MQCYTHVINLIKLYTRIKGNRVNIDATILSNIFLRQMTKLQIQWNWFHNFWISEQRVMSFQSLNQFKLIQENKKGFIEFPGHWAESTAAQFTLAHGLLGQGQRLTKTWPSLAAVLTHWCSMSVASACSRCAARARGHVTVWPVVSNCGPVHEHELTA